MRRLILGLLFMSGCGTEMNASDAAAPDAAAPDLAVRDAGREAGTPDLAVDAGLSDLAAGADGGERMLGFARSDTLIVAGPYYSAYYQRTGDFNGDGRTDFLSGISAMGDFGALNGWNVIFTDGTGKARPGPAPFTMWKGFIPLGLAIADFDGDKGDDVLISDPNYGTLVELGNGDGTFHPSAIDGASGNTVIADIDGDGKNDFVRTGLQNGAPVLQVFLNAGGGKFAVKAQIASVQGVASLVSGDFNADNRVDVLSLVNSNNTYFMQVLLGNGDGTFMVVPGKTKLSTAPCLLAGDFNADHVSDIASPAGVFLGNGDGTFGALLPVPLARCPAMGDYDGDGKLDLAVPANKGFAIYRGLGDGTFDKAVAFPLLPYDPDSIFTMDLDGDGRPDLATSGRDFEAGKIDLFLNTTK